MNKFLEPLQREYKWNPYGILNIIGSLGLIPAIFAGRYYDSIWVCLGVIILWYLVVLFSYLTYRYFCSSE